VEKAPDVGASWTFPAGCGADPLTHHVSLSLYHARRLADSLERYRTGTVRRPTRL